MKTLKDVPADDRVGLGWRREISSHILMNADKIDVIEVMVDDYLHAPDERIHALQSLMREIPTCFHGNSLGLASASPIDELRLERMCRTLERLGAVEWSEHLAFVRAAGVEIGHLAAPPRTEAVIEGTLANLRRIRQRFGRIPDLENVATLIRPPGEMSEPEWITQIAERAGANLLLDLHNLYANAMNGDRDPLAELLRLPLSRVRQVHLSGGPWSQTQDSPGSAHLMDEHIHDVPEALFALLEELAARADQDLTVVIERDGNFPPFSFLLHEVGRAREALKRGRERRQPARDTRIISLFEARAGSHG